MRGNRRGGNDYPRGARSIPACAGEPLATGAFCVVVRVYPRVCGGTSPIRQHHPPDDGLSPRVRGNRLSIRRCAAWSRSIPACAGEPPRRLLTRSHPPVYPRVCGGTDASTYDNLSGTGLSPRVRGNRRKADMQARQSRSIPACAGEPATRPKEANYEKVYPRVCGGTPAAGTLYSIRTGLSPRVRGNPRRGRQGTQRKRSIPACAGEPIPKCGK